MKNKLRILFVSVVMLVLTITSVSAVTVYFDNGGQGSVTKSSTSVQAVAYHQDGYPCSSTVEASFTNGSVLKVGPVTGNGMANAYRNGLNNVAGARGILLINGERKVAFA